MIKQFHPISKCNSNKQYMSKNKQYMSKNKSYMRENRQYIREANHTGGEIEFLCAKKRLFEKCSIV